MSFDPLTITPALRHRRDALAARTEAAGLNATQVHEEFWLDGWLLRGANTRLKRLRSIQAVATGSLPLDQKLARCAEAYAAWGQPLLFRITPFSEPFALDTELAARGYLAFDPVHVMSAALPACPVVPVDLPFKAVSQREFAELAAPLDGESEQAIADACARARRYPQTGRFLVLREVTDVVALGCLIVDNDMAGLYGLRTHPDRRGEGIGKQLLAALIEQARHTPGVRQLCLQVGADNAPARAIYQRFGFTDCHAYWYRRPAD